MANNVEIKVEANADISGLTQADNALDKLGGSAEQAAKKASVLGDVFTGALGAQIVTEIGAKLGEFATSAINLADHLADLSAKAGTSASDLQRIGNAAADNGSSVDQVADAMVKLAINSQKAVDGSSAMATAFERLGVPLSEIKTLSPDELFLKIADSVAGASDRAEAFNAVQAIMGESAKDLFATLSLGSDDIKRLGESFGVMSDQAVASLDHTKQSIDKFKSNLQSGIGNIIGYWDKLTKDLANSFYGISEAQAKAFEEMEANAKKAAASTKSAMDDAAESVGNVGKEADAASKKLALIDEAFAKRSLGELSPENKLTVIRQKIEELRDAAAQQFDIKFGNAADLNTIANGLGKNALAAKEMAVELASLEDAEKKAREEAEKKAPADKKGAEALNEKAAAARHAADALRSQADGEREALQAELQSLQGQFHQTMDVRQRQADIQSRLFDLNAPAPSAQPSTGGNGSAQAVSDAGDQITTVIGEVSTAVEDLGDSISDGLGDVAKSMNDMASSIPDRLKPMNSAIDTMGDGIAGGVETFCSAVSTKLADVLRRISVAEQQIANLR